MTFNFNDLPKKPWFWAFVAFVVLIIIGKIATAFAALFVILLFIFIYFTYEAYTNNSGWQGLLVITIICFFLLLFSAAFVSREWKEKVPQITPTTIQTSPATTQTPPASLNQTSPQ
jgi:hypothetical protein